RPERHVPLGDEVFQAFSKIFQSRNIGIILARRRKPKIQIFKNGVDKTSISRSPVLIWVLTHR
ncbi:MAG: hypothetical protein ACK481_04235, partial [Candidatus Melainabacteria bacterium]